MTRCCLIHCPKRGACGLRGSEGHCDKACHRLLSEAKQSELDADTESESEDEPLMRLYCDISCDYCETNCITDVVYHRKSGGVDYCQKCYNLLTAREKGTLICYSGMLHPYGNKVEMCTAAYVESWILQLAEPQALFPVVGNM